MTPSKLLLDTHIVVWALTGKRFSDHTMDLLGLAEKLFCSAASVWELSIKAADGDIELPKGWVSSIIGTGIELMDVTTEHAQAIAAVTIKTADPFDRLLVAQAMTEGLGLLTADRALISSPYPFILKA